MRSAAPQGTRSVSAGDSTPPTTRPLPAHAVQTPSPKPNPIIYPHLPYRDHQGALFSLATRWDAPIRPEPSPISKSPSPPAKTSTPLHTESAARQGDVHIQQGFEHMEYFLYGNK